MPDAIASKDAPKGSLLRSYAARHAEKIKETTTQVPVPSWKMDNRNILLFDVRVLEREWLEKYMEQSGGRRTLDTDFDLIYEACNGFWMYDGKRAMPGKRLVNDSRYGSGDYVRVEHESGEPVKIEEALADALGYEIKTDTPNNELIMHLFGNNGASVGSFATRLALWMQDTDSDITSLIVGE